MKGIGRRHGRVAVGHPVDVASGTFFDTHVDHYSRGLIPLSLARNYSTAFVTRENFGPAAERIPHLPFGPGWRADWQAELRRTLDGFTYTTPDGAVFPLVNPRSGGFGTTGRLVDPALGIELQRIDDRRVRLVGFDLTRSRFSLIFELSTDAIEYNLVSVMATSEARLDIYRDSNGKVTTLYQTREQCQYEIAYHGDRVVGVQLRLPDQSTRPAASYGYDLVGRLVEVRDEGGVCRTYAYDDADRIVYEASRAGATYNVAYRSDGRCSYVSGANRYQERTLRYDVDARQTWVYDSHGKATHYQWNEAGQVIQTTSPMGVQTRAEFDLDDRLVRETLSSGALVEYGYDDSGKLVLARHPGGRETRLRHDNDHRIVLIEESNGGRVQYTYDEEHNPVAIQLNKQPPWRYHYNAFGEVTAIEDPSGATAHVTYDTYGGVNAETDVDGATWRWSRDALGRAVAEIDPMGATRHIEYLDDVGSMRLTDADGKIYERMVSADERTIVVRLPGGAAKTVQLSTCGQPIEIRDEEGGLFTLTWGTEPGELLSIRNANGDVYTITYDADMRIVERQTFDGRVVRTEWNGELVSARTDGMGNRIAYTYDERSYLVRRETPEGMTEYTYDPYGNIASITSPESHLLWEWNSEGFMVAEEQDGRRVERTLNVMGQPLMHKTPFGEISRFEWTPGGKCTRVDYREVSIHFGWDALGREMSRSLSGAGRFEQTYDPCGRLLTQVFREEGEDARSPRLARRFEYDERGFLSIIEDSTRGRTRLLHNQRGDLVGVLRQGNLSEFYDFDPARNRLLHATTERGEEFAQALESTGYRSLFQVLNRIPAETLRSNYMPGNRLVSIEGIRERIDLTYDANGQVIAKSVIREDGEREVWEFRWNSRGQLIALIDPRKGIWSYRYDGCGRRVEKKSPTGFVWTYIWIGDMLVHVLRNGELAETYVHEPYGNCPLIRDEGTVHYILPDQADAPSEEVSMGGAATWSARKETWGGSFSHVGTSGGEPFLGQWYDRESGLHYNGQRYYDPDTGRFLSPDPLDLLAGTHAYLGAMDPFSEYDRNGLVVMSSSSPRWGGPYTPDQIDVSRVKQGLRDDTDKPQDRGKAVLHPKSDDPITVNMEDNTLTTVSQGRRKPSFYTLNGTDGPENRKNRVRPGEMSDQVSHVTWNHAEMHAFDLLLRGNHPGIEPGRGTIRIDISQPPCKQKNGCDTFVPKLAQEIANKFGVNVTVNWPPRKKRKVKLRVRPEKKC